MTTHIQPAEPWHAHLTIIDLDDNKEERLPSWHSTAEVIAWEFSEDRPTDAMIYEDGFINPACYENPHERQRTATFHRGTSCAECPQEQWDRP